MKIKIFTIPITDNGGTQRELNHFLALNKILKNNFLVKISKHKMKKKSVLIFALVNMLFLFGFAQNPDLRIQKTVDTINAIIKENKLAYYVSNKHYSAFITKISATEQGIVHFTDSIPKPETAALPTNATKKIELISDCCPPKNSRTIDVFAIHKWEIHFPYLYPKDENNKTIGKFIGFKKADLKKLIEQFEKLKSLCKKVESSDN